MGAAIRFAARRRDAAAGASAFPTFFRPNNDTLTRLVRTMLDCAAELDARLAEELEEDAEAEAWAARNPAWRDDDDDDIVPLSQVPS